ncbi:hypothetical protein MJI51_04760, partial [Salmonella enterica subsp. enterica serovar Kentucky]|nr:hypothetical protein [Salmonella enterica subsp. enterica serovar Kentucky]
MDMDSDISGDFTSLTMNLTDQPDYLTVTGTINPEDARIPLEEAEQYKRSNAQEIWPVVKPVYEKMAEIVACHIAGQGVTDLWLAGGSCMQPGVEALFRQRFPELQVHLPQHSLFMTPLAIANSGRAKAEGLYAS